MDNEKETEFLVHVNGQRFGFSRQEIEAADIINTGDDTYHLLKDHRSFTATAVQNDPTGKTATIEIDGETMQVQVKDSLDQVLDKMGFSTTASRHLQEIKAPMPGLVLQVNVTEGQEVKEGDKLLILVAMKMENSIAVHADATIKKIHVNAGQAVDKGQLLLELH